MYIPKFSGSQLLPKEIRKEFQQSWCHFFFWENYESSPFFKLHYYSFCSVLLANTSSKFMQNEANIQTGRRRITHDNYSDVSQITADVYKNLNFLLLWCCMGSTKPLSYSFNHLHADTFLKIRCFHHFGMLFLNTEWIFS